MIKRCEKCSGWLIRDVDGQACLTCGWTGPTRMPTEKESRNRRFERLPDAESSERSFAVYQAAQRANEKKRVVKQIEG